MESRAWVISLGKTLRLSPYRSSCLECDARDYATSSIEKTMSANAEAAENKVAREATEKYRSTLMQKTTYHTIAQAITGCLSQKSATEQRKVVQRDLGSPKPARIRTFVRHERTG